MHEHKPRLNFSAFAGPAAAFTPTTGALVSLYVAFSGQGYWQSRDLTEKSNI